MAVSLDEIYRRIGVGVPLVQERDGSAMSIDTPAEHEDRVTRMVERLLTDSRSLARAEGTLFFALHTHTGDGHFYLQSLYARGVRMFVVERIPEQMRNLHDATFIVVPDTMEALQRIGQPETGYRGVTLTVSGSRGKTVVKEWLYRSLQQLARPDGSRVRVYRSPRSFNSQTGVPLSLWQVPAAADYAVIETGISQPGEMEVLERLTRPEIAIFTTIDATTHAEGFINLRAKAEEKALMAAHASVSVYNADIEPLASAIEQRAGGRLFGWSRIDSDAALYIYNERIEGSDSHATLRYAGEEVEIHLPFAAPADVDDAMTVFAALLAMGHGLMDLQPVADILKPVRTRMDVVEGVNGCTVVVDGYESDMASLPEAIDFMRRHSSREQKLTLIISDLTDGTDAAYDRLAEMVRRGGIERVIGVGPGMRRHMSLPGMETFVNTDALLATLSVADFSGEFVMVKSTPGDGLESVAEMLAARKHETVLEVNLGALARNYASYKRRLPEGTGIVAMVKASAYGMGSYEVARTLQDAGADYLAVAVIDEGLELRRRGITMPVMVMNPKVVNYRSMFANRLEPEIYSAAMLEDVIEEARRNDVTEYPVHIKLDTGMHRTGFVQEELESLCRRLGDQHQVRVASVFSHLATADCPDMDVYTLGQCATFERMTDYMAARIRYPFKRHILNSAGITRFPQYGFDMARLGIGLYGVNTLPQGIDNPVEPVASLRTVIISLRTVEAGEAVGYGRAGKVERRSTIATLPIGYADGFNRHLGRGAIKVQVGGRQAPTIGNICMDQCMIDVTGIDCKVGDEVIIFGPQLGIERIAEALDTIPYEILTSVSPRVKRLYYRE